MNTAEKRGRESKRVHPPLPPKKNNKKGIKT